MKLSGLNFEYYIKTAAESAAHARTFAHVLSIL